MISFIIDGFDPWSNILPLLEQIRSEIQQPYEVILATSLLLDTPLKECQAKGEELLGNSFCLLATDNTQVFETRLEAQAQARGDTFFYLSPVVRPKTGTLKILAQSGKTQSAIFCQSAPITFLYPSGISERILAHGYGSDDEGALVPLYAGQKPDMLPGNAEQVIPLPFCFCSKEPFYKMEDRTGNFWQAHLAACSRKLQHCASVANAPCALNPGAFASYQERIDLARYPQASTIEHIATDNGISLALNAYGDFRTGTNVADKTTPQSEEAIFWELLHNPSPEMIARASAGEMEEPLAWLARATLRKIASSTWEICEGKARRRLCPSRPGWQKYDEWLSLHQLFRNTAYASISPDWRQICTKPASIPQMARNLATVLTRGLFGRFTGIKTI